MLYLQPTENKSEVSRLRRERDEMQSMLEKFEKHLTSVSPEVLPNCRVYIAGSNRHIRPNLH